MTHSPELSVSANYGRGCRCDFCRADRAAYARDWRARNPNKGKVERICFRCEKEYLAWPDNTRNGRVQKYCSQTCAGNVADTGKRMARTYIGHPLAGATGKVLVHRYVLYESIGEGPHACHWCGTSLEWIVRTGRGAYKAGDLIVDHLDNNPRNNDIANLVPACQRASDAMCCAGSSKLGRRTRAVR